MQNKQEKEIPSYRFSHRVIKLKTIKRLTKPAETSRRFVLKNRIMNLVSECRRDFIRTTSTDKKKKSVSQTRIKF